MEVLSNQFLAQVVFLLGILKSFTLDHCRFDHWSTCPKKFFLLSDDTLVGFRDVLSRERDSSARNEDFNKNANGNITQAQFLSTFAQF